MGIYFMEPPRMELSTVHIICSIHPALTPYVVVHRGTRRHAQCEQRCFGQSCRCLLRPLYGGVDTRASVNHWTSIRVNHYMCISINHCASVRVNHYNCISTNHCSSARVNHCICSSTNHSTGAAVNYSTCFRANNFICISAKNCPRVREIVAPVLAGVLASRQLLY